MIPVGESLLAVVGVTKPLKDQMPYVGVGLQHEAIELPKKIAALAKQLVANELPERLAMPRPWTYRAALAMFLQPIPEATIEHITSKFPDGSVEGAVPFISELQVVYKHLADEFPVADYQTLLAPKKIQPTSDKIWRWYSRYWVIDDPMVAFPLMQMGALLPSQADALKTYFPGVYEEIKSALLAALVDRSIHDASFINLPPRADLGVARFLGKKVVAYGSNVNVKQPEQQGPTNVAISVKVPSSLQTAGQRAQGEG